MPRHNGSENGFTLVELLIVVIILAILAAIAIPQFTGSSEDARLSALQPTLGEMRNAVELYYHQHKERYPGAYAETDGTTATTTAAGAATAFSAQLTQYTDANGKVSTTKTSVFKYGPYLKNLALPKNPFITDPTKADLVLVDITVADITAAPTATTTNGEGWKFYLKTGRFVANDGTTLSDGTTKTIDQ